MEINNDLIFITLCLACSYLLILWWALKFTRLKYKRRKEETFAWARYYNSPMAKYRRQLSEEMDKAIWVQPLWAYPIGFGHSSNNTITKNITS